MVTSFMRDYGCHPFDLDYSFFVHHVTELIVALVTVDPVMGGPSVLEQREHVLAALSEPAEGSSFGGDVNIGGQVIRVENRLQELRLRHSQASGEEKERLREEMIEERIRLKKQGLPDR